MSDGSSLSSIELATELTIAWLGNPHTRITADDVPVFLQSMHSAVEDLAAGGFTSSADEAHEATYTPAVSVRKSLASRDHIISLIDGKPYRTLRRHLSGHGLTPEQYRERYGLKADYPMVAPSYSEARRDMAHRIGLGSKARAARGAAKSVAKPQRKTKTK